jgi:hypothetical protein
LFLFLFFCSAPPPQSGAEQNKKEFEQRIFTALRINPIDGSGVFPSE